MTWPLDVDLTVEEQLGTLALIIYLNTGIAWYYYCCRKSERYKEFECRVIRRPPLPSPLPPPAPAASSWTDRAAHDSLSPSRFVGTGYALKRWGFVTASVLFWILHALLLLAIQLRKVLAQLGATIAACAYVAYEWTWRREVWHAKRDWERELAVDAAESEKNAMLAVPPAVLQARGAHRLA